MKKAVWFLTPLLLSAQTAVVEGSAILRATGKPVAGLHVWLEGAPNVSTATEADGHFRFSNAPTGANVVLHVSGAGLLDYIRVLNPAAGENVTGIRLPMLPEAVIAGKVEDEDGWPVFQASVTALCYSVPQGWRETASAGTNERGEYRLGKLPPGRYWLRVEPGSRMKGWDARYLTAFYPGAPPAPDAPAVTLDIGQKVSGLDIRLRKEEGRQVRGRVIWPPGNDGTANRLSLEWEDPYTRVTRRVNIALAPDGGFVARRIAPGSYKLVAEVGDIPISNTQRPAAYRRIEVADADIEGIVLEVKALAGRDVAGSLTGDTGGKPDGFQVVLTGIGHVFTAQPGSDGDFVVHGVPPGHYQVGLRRPDGRPEGNVAIRYGNNAAVSRNLIEVDDQQALPLRIAALPPRIAIHGSVTDTDKQPMAGAVVALWGGTAERYLPQITLPGGEFSVQAPEPGVYHVYVVDDVALQCLIQDPQYLKAHVNDYPPVTIVQGQNPPLVLVYSGK
jgi:hypothetical protein